VRRSRLPWLAAALSSVALLVVLLGGAFLYGIYATEHRLPVVERVRAVKRAFLGGAIAIRVLPADAAASTIRALRRECDDVLHRGRVLNAEDPGREPGTYVCRHNGWPTVYVFSPRLMAPDATIDDPETVRAALRRFVQPSARAAAFEDVGRGARGGPAERCGAATTPITRRYRYTLDGFTSLIDVVGNGPKLVIYHGGHDGVQCDVLARILAANHRVAVLDMPLSGANAARISRPWPGGTLIATTHNHLGALESDDFEPVRLFLEPVVRVVEALRGEHPTIAMIGASGGAWTTTLACAAEPRIALCMAVSGSTPLHLRTTAEMGDWEQVTPTLFNRFTYEDYYLASAHPSGRTSVLVRNRLDSCCHSVPLPQATARLLEESAARRRLDLRSILEVSPGHGISERMLAMFLGLVAER
jgi:hypothetical protein